MTTSKKVSEFVIDGLVTAPFTPFKEDGELNLAMIEPYVEHIIKFGIKNVFVNGTTGEGMSMTVDERKSAAEAWIKASKGRLVIIVHVGGLHLKDCMGLARHAQEIGADAIACIASLYYKPANAENLVEYLQPVAAEAPELPFYYYDINFMTGVKVDLPQMIKLASEKIPTFRGLKNSSKEIPGFAECMLASESLKGPPIQIMKGSDSQFLAGLAMGVDVPVMNSYMAPIFLRMIKAHNKGDNATARKEQLRAYQVCGTRDRTGMGGLAAGKGMMRLLGVDLGPCRLPLKRPSNEELEVLKKQLTEMGFFDWLKEPVE